jgi:hypothetical protein
MTAMQVIKLSIETREAALQANNGRISIQPEFLLMVWQVASASPYDLTDDSISWSLMMQSCLSSRKGAVSLRLDFMLKGRRRRKETVFKIHVNESKYRADRAASYQSLVNLG